MKIAYSTPAQASPAAIKGQRGSRSCLRVQWAVANLNEPAAKSALSPRKSKNGNGNGNGIGNGKTKTKARKK